MKLTEWNNNFFSRYFSYFNIIPTPFQCPLFKNAKFEWKWGNLWRESLKIWIFVFVIFLVISPLNSLCLKILHAKFGSNCLSCSGEVYFQISFVDFNYFFNKIRISLIEETRILFTKGDFVLTGWNSLRSSGEVDF